MSNIAKKQTETINTWRAVYVRIGSIGHVWSQRGWLWQAITRDGLMRRRRELLLQRLHTAAGVLQENIKLNYWTELKSHGHCRPSVNQQLDVATKKKR